MELCEIIFSITSEKLSPELCERIWIEITKKFKKRLQETESIFNINKMGDDTRNHFNRFMGRYRNDQLREIEWKGECVVRDKW